MNEQQVKTLLAALRYASEQCEEMLKGDITHKDPLAQVAVAVARLFEEGGNDRPLREWFREAEIQTARELVRNGANGPKLAQYMGTSDAAVRVYLHRVGILITDFRDK